MWLAIERRGSWTVGFEACAAEDLGLQVLNAKLPCGDWGRVNLRVAAWVHLNAVIVQNVRKSIAKPSQVAWN